MTLALYRRNIRFLGQSDVLLATYPGSGTTLVGNVLLELNLNYVDPYTEILRPDGSSVPASSGIAPEFRRRIAATQRRDTAALPQRARRWPRIAKSHLFPNEYAARPLLGAWILARDPRDAVYSWYAWRRGFWGCDAQPTTDGFEAFLQEIDGGERESDGLTPLAYWSSFYRSWLTCAERYEHHAVLRFEEIKSRDGAGVLHRAISTVAPDISERDVCEALHRSTFQKMRAHEDRVVEEGGQFPHARIMRRGKSAGWMDWMTPQLEPYFSDRTVVDTATQCGYAL